MRRNGASVGAVVAAVLLPPLGVYMTRGLGGSFWIAVLLTIFWWIPGIVFALLVILAPQRVPAWRDR